MHKLKNQLFFLLFSLLSLTSNSQMISLPFGNISRADLEMTVYKPDPDASAVILSDRGHAKLVYNGRGFQIELERNIQIKIINSQGFDYANVEISYLKDDKLLRVKASTYNLVSDSIVETELNPKEFINDKSSKYWRTLRIAFQNVSEGSIIEYQYRHITESAMYIHEFIPWEFQAEIPTRFSEFTGEYNNFFNYNGLIKGESNLISRQSSSKEVFVGGYRATGWIHKWVGNNIPAFKREPYLASTKDYLTKLEFELAGTNFPGTGYSTITPTYKELPKKILERNDFGIALKKTGFLKKPTTSVVSDCEDDLCKLKAIHSYVSNKILWDGRYRFGASQPLRDVFNQERGTSAEVNMLLIAMLRHAGLRAHPVILSTRANGMLHPSIAMIQKFNYVIANVKIGEKTYLVDATDPLLPFNNLPFYSLNGQGRFIHEDNSTWVNLSNNERNISIIRTNIQIDANGKLTGSTESSYGGYRAHFLRKFIKLETVKGYNDYVIAKQPSWVISNLQVQNIENLSDYVVESYDFMAENGTQITSAGIIINPFLFALESGNPFTSEERKYPIDFGCPELTTYSITIKIPDGYMVEEKPSNLTLRLPEKGGVFLMSCEQQGNEITIQTRLNVDQIRYKASDYKTLREFYSQITRKLSELIVLKKV